jgi:hypothetical protein
MKAASTSGMFQKSARWLFALVSVCGCGGGTSDGRSEPGSGGSSGASGGTAGAQTGGATASGGASATGGTLASGGVYSSGGQVQHLGGASTDGGASSGGSASGGRASGGSGGRGGTASTGGTAGGGAGGSGGKLGTGGVDARCPAHTPAIGSMCDVSELDLECRYTYLSGCLCALQAGSYCPTVDPLCTGLSGGSGGVSAFAAPAQSTGSNGPAHATPIPSTRACSCWSGSWTCLAGG